jgi:hypothetical protein
MSNSAVRFCVGPVHVKRLRGNLTAEAKSEKKGMRAKDSLDRPTADTLRRLCGWDET